MKITDYNHVQITVPPESAEQVRQFYGQLLGLKEKPVPPNLQGRGLIWFEVGPRELHVGVETGVNRTATRAHAAYQVDDMQACRQLLSTAGFQIIEQPKIPGLDRIHTVDPFGNRLELIGPASD